MFGDTPISSVDSNWTKKSLEFEVKLFSWFSLNFRYKNVALIDLNLEYNSKVKYNLIENEKSLNLVKNF